MTMKHELYPTNWKEISLSIRERANWQCEQCGVKQGAIGARDLLGNWHDEDDIHSLNSDEGYRLFGDNFNWKMTKIVLTVHHLGIPHDDGNEGSTHDKMDCRPENLICLCQKHHLEADMPGHLANRRITVAKKRAASIAATGQKSLFEMDGE